MKIRVDEAIWQEYAGFLDLFAKKHRLSSYQMLFLIANSICLVSIGADITENDFIDCINKITAAYKENKIDDRRS